jgi:hypothetical protein
MNAENTVVVSKKDVSPVKTGVQNIFDPLNFLDSGFRHNGGMCYHLWRPVKSAFSA